MSNDVSEFQILLVEPVGVSVAEWGTAARHKQQLINTQHQAGLGVAHSGHLCVYDRLELPLEILFCHGRGLACGDRPLYTCGERCLGSFHAVPKCQQLIF